MSNFKIGQKVVCIESSPLNEDSMEFVDSPKVNEIVTINWIGEIGDTLGWLGFQEYDVGECWDSKEYRALDHQFAEDLCASITRQVKREFNTTEA